MRKDRIVDTLVRDRFLVTMQTGEVFAGVLWDYDDRTFILADAEAVAADNSRVKSDGDLFLARDRISYMQRIN